MAYSEELADRIREVIDGRPPMRGFVDAGLDLADRRRRSELNRLKAGGPEAPRKTRFGLNRRRGCLLCKPHKLTANVKAQRNRDRSWVRHEQIAYRGS